MNLDILGAPDEFVMDLGAERGRAMNEDQRTRMRGIVAELEARGGDWGFKDPRTCLTWDLWASELPEHRVIGVYREPSEVWPRFKWQGWRRRHMNFHYATRYLKRWYEHNAAVVAAVDAAGDRGIMIGHRELMTDDAELARLAAFTGRDLDDRRNPGLYRSRDGRDFFYRWGESSLRRAVGRGPDALMAELAERRLRTGA